MAGVAAFRPNPSIQTAVMANGQSCFVVDDALLEPDRLVEYAIARRHEFSNVDFSAYPGVYLPIPTAITTALADFFSVYLRRRFDARRVQHVHSRLSMVTTIPSRLQPYQSMCHQDPPALDPRHSIQASLLYLFTDSDLGGTSFYEPAHSVAETSRLFHDAAVLPPDQFWLRYSMQPAYMCASNEWFTRVGGVQARWNRAIFYDGSALHSSDIPQPDRLTDDPATGRLTLNGFFTSRRSAASLPSPAPSGTSSASTPAA